MLEHRIKASCYVVKSSDHASVVGVLEVKEAFRKFIMYLVELNLTAKQTNNNSLYYKNYYKVSSFIFKYNLTKKIYLNNNAFYNLSNYLE